MTQHQKQNPPEKEASVEALLEEASVEAPLEEASAEAPLEEAAPVEPAPAVEEPPPVKEAAPAPAVEEPPPAPAVEEKDLPPPGSLDTSKPVAPVSPAPVSPAPVSPILARLAEKQAEEGPAPEKAPEEDVGPSVVQEGTGPYLAVDDMRNRVSRSLKISVEELRAREEAARTKYEGAKQLYDAHDGKVRNFDDIFARFPLGNGEFEVYVERKTPRRYQGRTISGIQRSIKQIMKHQEFAETYGKGLYQLTVYGPARNGALDEEGNLKLMPYTKPIRVEIPDPYNDNPPNLDMAAVGSPDGGEDEMQVLRRGDRRTSGATDADAHIREAELRFEESAEERRWRIEQEEREREEAKREAEQRRQDDLATRMLESKEREVERMREEMREMRDRNPQGEQISSIAQLMAAVRPPSSQGQVEQLTQTLADERSRYSDEMNRIRDAHRGEVDRIIREKDDLIRVERQRADDRIREERDSSRQREADLRTSLEQRLNDERRQHDRDLQTVRESHTMMHTSGENTFKVQLEVKQQEVGRLQQENLRLQAELDAERKKTLAERVNEFSGAAEALGFSKDEGGDTSWKGMLADAAMGLVQHGPALASALRGGGGGGMPPQQMGQLPPAQLQQMAQDQVRMPPPPAFATDGVEIDTSDPDGGYDPSGTYQPPVYGFDGEMPSAAPPAHAPPPQGPVQQAPVQAPAQAPVQQPAQQPATPQTQAMVPQPQQDDGVPNIDDAQILEFSSMFRQAFEEGADAEYFSTELVNQFGPMMSGGIVRDIPLARVNKVLQEGPDGDTDPLVRRDGQEFLSKVWAKVEAKTQGQQG